MLAATLPLGKFDGLPLQWKVSHKKVLVTALASLVDGRSRIDKFSSRPDMGCYEYLPSGTMFKVR